MGIKESTVRPIRAASHLPRSIHSHRLHLRAATGTALLAVILCGGCETAPVAPTEPGDAIAEVQMEFNPVTGNITTTVIPLRPAEPTSDAETTSGILALQDVGDLVQPVDSAKCVKCRNGTLGLHSVSLTLRNESAFNLNRLRFDPNGYRLTGCLHEKRNDPPGSLAPGESYTQSFVVNVKQSPFRITFRLQANPRL